MATTTQPSPIATLAAVRKERDREQRERETRGIDRE